MWSTALGCPVEPEVNSTTATSAPRPIPSRHRTARQQRVEGGYPLRTPIVPSCSAKGMPGAAKTPSAATTRSSGPPRPAPPGGGWERPPHRASNRRGTVRSPPTSWEVARRRRSPSDAERPKTAGQPRRPPVPAPRHRVGHAVDNGRPGCGPARREELVERRHIPRAARAQIPRGISLAVGRSKVHRLGTGPSTRSCVAKRTGGAFFQLGIPSSGSATGYLLSWISAQWEWFNWWRVKHACSEL